MNLSLPRIFPFLFFSCFVLFSCRLIAQDSTQTPQADLAYLNDASPLIPQKEYNNSLQLVASFRQNSNSLPLGFTMKFIAKGAIDKSFKDRLKSFPGRRLYEDELKAGLTYQHHFVKQDFYFFVSYNHRNIRTADVTKDALNLLLYGNKMYEDKTANLSNMNFEDLMYNQYSIGFGKQEKNLYASINISFLQGFNNQQLKTTNASFYTAPYGEYIDVKYGFTYNQSHAGATPFFALKGIGLSGDVHVAYQFKKGLLQFDVQDLGLISWGKESFNYGKDTTVHFEGVVIDDILKLNSTAFGKLNLDSIFKNVASAKSNRGYNTILPATVQLSFSHLAHIKKTKVQLNYGLQTRYLSHFYVMAFAKANFFLPKHVVTSVSLSGGGYSLFNLGWDIGYFDKHIRFFFGTHNLIGLLAPNHYPSSSLNLRLQYIF